MEHAIAYAMEWLGIIKRQLCSLFGFILLFSAVFNAAIEAKAHSMGKENERKLLSCRIERLQKLVLESWGLSAYHLNDKSGSDVRGKIYSDIKGDWYFQSQSLGNFRYGAYPLGLKELPDGFHVSAIEFNDGAEVTRVYVQLENSEGRLFPFELTSENYFGDCTEWVMVFPDGRKELSKPVLIYLAALALAEMGHGR